MLFMFVVERQRFCSLHFVIFELCEQPFIRQIQTMRVFPVMVSNGRQAFEHLVVAHLYRQFPATVKAAGREIDGSNDGAHMITEEHFGMQLEMLQFVNLDADVFHDAHAADGLNEFLLLELVRRAGHDVNLHSTAGGADQSLDDYRVLVALILKEDGTPGVINKLRDAISAVTAAPDEMGMFVSLEGLSMPVSFEAFDDLGYFVSDVK